MIERRRLTPKYERDGADVQFRNANGSWRRGRLPFFTNEKKIERNFERGEKLWIKSLFTSIRNFISLPPGGGLSNVVHFVYASYETGPFLILVIIIYGLKIYV